MKDKTITRLVLLNMTQEEFGEIIREAIAYNMERMGKEPITSPNAEIRMQRVEKLEKIKAREE